jgi:hypothetical protein
VLRVLAGRDRRRHVAAPDAGRRLLTAGPRSLGGCGNPLCVVPLCRVHHRAYDRGELDLLAHLEPGWRAQLAHAVGHVGLIGALRRISGDRQATNAIGEA